LSAVSRIHSLAAVGEGNPPVPDPLAGIPFSPFFMRDLRFVTAVDKKGRMRLAALTIHSPEKD
jgi:hypothetical protein